MYTMQTDITYNVQAQILPLTPVDVQKEIVLLNLRLSRPGIKRRVASTRIEVDADKDAIQVSKSLLACPEYTAIERFDRDVRSWTGQKCLPAHRCLKEGIYRVPVTIIDEIEKDLKQLWAVRIALVDKMAAAYVAAIESAEARLRSLFNASDYLSVNDFIASFNFTWNYFTLAIPQSLTGYVAEQEAKKFLALQEASLNECREALRLSFAELVNRAVDRLGFDDGGKPCAFHETMLTKFEDFIRYFQARNLADDTSLAALVAQAREIMSTIPDAAELRTNFDLRQQCQVAFARIQDAAIDAGIITSPVRQLDLD